MKILTKQIICLCTVLSVFALNTSGQDSSSYRKDYRSIKLLHGTIGIIGIGFGGGAALDLPLGRLLITGSVGYKDSSVRDSTMTYNGHQYTRIITGDGKGLVYSAGIGFRINRKEVSERMFIAVSTSTEDHYSYSVIHMRGHYENFPCLKSKYVLLEIVSMQTGKFIQAYKGFNDKVNIFVPGSNIYFSPRLRSMKEINYGSYDAYILKTYITDVGLVLSPDLKQIGACLDGTLIKGAFHIGMGCSLIRRLDRPNTVDNPFDSDTKYKWVFPFRITMGLTLYKKDNRKN
jgi:hypothetical protein